jgi:ribonuclease HII
MSEAAQLALSLHCDEGIGSVERALRVRGVSATVGVDEAGRGPLAGPVVVAAVRLPLGDLEWTAGLDDSKRLTEAARERWYDEIAERLEHAVVAITPREIDELNILGATLEGMRRAAEGLTPRDGEEVLVDGKTPIPALGHPQRCLVGGDRRSIAVAAASVLAKVTRDREMRSLDERFPDYGFARHKGYPTAAHLAALQRVGPCEAHRRSFGPVRAMLGTRQ